MELYFCYEYNVVEEHCSSERGCGSRHSSLQISWGRVEALDGKVAAAVRSNFSREKFKGKYEAQCSDCVMGFIDKSRVFSGSAAL